MKRETRGMTAKNPKILVVDDEPIIREIVADLIVDSFQPLQAANGREAFEIAKAEQPALILLDIIMPEVDGIEACDLLRSHPVTKHIPVIMLSAAGNLENRISSFKNGADDFIPKPFNADEIVPRIMSKIRRSRESQAKRKKMLICGNLAIDLGERSVFIDGTSLSLSETELKLIFLLVKRSGKLVTRKEILRKVWEDVDASDRLIDAHIVALRKTLAGFDGEFITV